MTNTFMEKLRPVCISIENLYKEHGFLFPKYLAFTVFAYHIFVGFLYILSNFFLIVCCDIFQRDQFNTKRQGILIIRVADPGLDITQIHTLKKKYWIRIKIDRLQHYSSPLNPDPIIKKKRIRLCCINVFIVSIL